MPLQFRDLLVPVDFSAASRRAARFAGGLCQEGTRLTLLHVVWPPDERHPELAWSSAQRQTARVEAEHRLKEFAAELGLPSPQFEVRVGVVAPTINSYLAESEHDLVVIPSHDRPTFVRWFRGSVSEPVVREANCAVLVLPPCEDPARAEELDARVLGGSPRVLVGVDLSDGSDDLINMGMDATDAPSKAHVLHVVAEPAPHSPGAIWNQYYGELALLRARQAVARKLLSLGHERAYAEVASGEVARSIVDHAAGLDADLVVLASHGRTGWRRFVLGSVTESYLREATRPTLVVRSKDASEKRSAA